MTTTTEAPARALAPGRARLERVELPDAVSGRLFFAQVREDSRLDVEALAPTPQDEVVVVGSAGCTALSLLAAGPAHVWSVDLNRTQHHLVELKVAALRTLAARDAAAFLGALDMRGGDRLRHYEAMRPLLGDDARAWWDARPRGVAAGVLGAGVSERFIRLVVAVVTALVHPRRRQARLLACRDIEEQRALYESEWNSRRWRLLFRLLLNRAVFRRTYEPGFFANVENPSFARHFHGTVERGLTTLPVRDNYFLHHMLTGRFPVDVVGGVPPYLSARGARQVAGEAHRLTLVDGSVTEFLRARADRTLHGFALSNVAEWLDEPGREALFREVARTAAPGARVVFRDFVGRTEVPWTLRDALVVDETLSASLTRRDRSLLQARIVVATRRGAA